MLLVSEASSTISRAWLMRKRISLVLDAMTLALCKLILGLPSLLLAFLTFRYVLAGL